MRRAVPALLAAAGVLAPQPAAAIVGGDEADPGEWPWQVALVEDGSVVCGGALLALDLVVTAAHCVDGVDRSSMVVRAGTVDLDEGGDERRVARLDQHEDYDGESSRNDIALLVLDRPFPAGDGIAAVALPDADTAAALVTPGAAAVVTGFGATSESGASSDVLLEAEVEVLDDATCTRWYAEDRDEVVGGSQVCAGLDRGHVDACYGDSGGPLVVPADDERTGWYLIGLVSWGAGCGRPLRPTVYTEVAAFTGWLDERGAIAAAGERFTSSAPLRLPAFGSRGKASRYPATVRVDGVDGPVTAVAVELRGLRHEHPADLDVWLRAPDGTLVTLLSDVGGDDPVDGVDVVVESGAPAAGDRPLPLRVAPTDRDPDHQRKGARPPADLDALVGTDPAGAWHLLVADDRGGAAGTLASWTLILKVG